MAEIYYTEDDASIAGAVIWNSGISRYPFLRQWLRPGSRFKTIRPRWR